MDCRRRRWRCGGEALPKDTIPPTHANGDTNTRYSTRQQQNGIQWVLTGCKWKSELEERKMWNKKIHIRYLSANYLCRMNYSTLLCPKSLSSSSFASCLPVCLPVDILDGFRALQFIIIFDCDTRTLTRVAQIELEIANYKSKNRKCHRWGTFINTTHIYREGNISLLWGPASQSQS